MSQAEGAGELSALDPSPRQTDELLAAAGGLVRALMTAHRDGDVLGHPRGDDLTRQLLTARPPASPTPVEDALATIGSVLATGADNAAPGELAYIPGSGLLTAAVADLIGGVANRYTGLSAFTPAAVALEQGVLSWLTELFGLPDTAQGLLLSGGSAANLTAVVAARDVHARGAVDRACLYVGQHAHASVRKAARIAGFTDEQVRVCTSADGLRLDPEAVRIAIKQDRADGLVPVAVVGAAGTTNTGSIDPLHELADVAREHGVWFHVDAAYGGFFQLTERGRQLLAGIERADSITLDPHKSLFLPFGTGALLVRDRAHLAASFAEEADYLRDAEEEPPALPDFSALGPELTREWRGLRLWLPLMLHGTDAFTAALDRALDLARWASQELVDDDHVEVVSAPELSILTFRVPGDDAAQDRALARIHADGHVRLSSTVLDGRVVLRLAVLSHRTSEDTLARAVSAIREAAHAAAATAGAADGGREG
ncbi:MAG: aminotransferase class V-fold PLP-dependent enzyme [Nitriliruptor sp.]|nr:MAG: aminotransferase class V-fold PLP-dependent enzyme [Nitriliruptor sp.]